ncbi:MAG TPA: hypothetical protein VJ997_01305, partial [Longimicrobiales bacterium]|nr:hypothetical protein [Longimicrobiales bacterium]
SFHATGGDFERSDAGCAICHTHQGFLERLPTNAYSTAARIDDPAPPNCRTCHLIHTTYTSADYALRATTPITLYQGGQVVDLGSEAGNLCGRCHQSRILSPMPAIGGPNITLSSSSATRYGGHHSPVAQIISGEGLFEFSGSATIAGGAFTHGDPDYNPGVCAGCHMAEAYGAQAGGHTLQMGYDLHGSEVENVAGCNAVGCHKTVEDFDHWNVRPEIKGLLSDLSAELYRLGIKADADPTSVSAKSGSFPGDVAAAFVNYQLITEDKSGGLHNPPYVRNVLKNTIAKMKTY